VIDFDEIVAFPGVRVHISLGRSIAKILDDTAPPSAYVDLFRGAGCHPSIYTMADVRKFVMLPEFWDWIAVHRPSLSLARHEYDPVHAIANAS
jgi:hypothetical protein